jgi:hypothetical protein
VQDDGQRQLLAQHCAEMRRNLLFRPLLEDERESGHLVLEAGACYQPVSNGEAPAAQD